MRAGGVENHRETVPEQHRLLKYGVGRWLIIKLSILIIT